MATTCECGNRKERKAEACRRCRELDGGALFDVVQALRVSELCSVAEVAADTGRSYNSAHKALLSLVRQGRAVSMRDDGDSASAPRLYALVGCWAA